MSFPRYPAYKDSGVVWLGDIPSHWKVKPMKWVITRNDGGVWGNDPKGEDDTVVLRSTEQTVDGRWQLDEPALRSLSETEKAGSLLATGDLLVTKSSGSALHIGKTTLVTPEVAALGCCYSNFMQRIRLKPEFDSRLAWYLMNNEIARTQFDLLSNSTTGLANLNGTMLGELVAPIPSPDEQAEIVRFLDRETAKIDALVTEQAQLITLLKEKRQAVISHAVTKGLNPSVPMKDSGVEWLGGVPAHWEVKPIGHVLDAIGDVDHFMPPSVDAGVPYLMTGDLRDHLSAVSLDDCKKVSRDDYLNLSKRIKSSKGDVIMARYATIGTMMYVDLDAEFLVSYSCVTLKPNSSIVSGEFLFCSMRSDSFRLGVESRTNTNTQGNIGIKDLRAVKIVVPPIDEQLEITSFLNAEITKLDEVREGAEQAISLMTERRSALISAAVTGQIDVRGLVAAQKAA